MVGLGAVLYDTREPHRRPCCSDGGRCLAHVTGVYEETTTGEVYYSVEDGTHTTREWVHQDDLLAIYDPAGWSVTGVKPTYLLTRQHGVKDHHDLRERLRDYRRKHGWTQDRLASELGVSKQTVSNWETDRHEIRGENRERARELLGKPHERRQYRCRACLDDPRVRVDETASWDLENDDEFGAVLDHYATEHPDADAFNRIVDETKMRTICEGCSTEFVGDLHVSGEHLTVDNYCADCVEEDPLRSLVVDSIPGRLVVERSVDTGTEQDGGST
jgi:transcriptional regulator with XRE-family HTH domain